MSGFRLLSWTRRLHLFNIERLVGPVFRLRDVSLRGVRGVFKICLLTKQQVHIRHGVFVFFVDVKALLEVCDTLLYSLQVLFFQLCSDLRILDWTGVSSLHADLNASRLDGSECLCPVNHT